MRQVGAAQPMDVEGYLLPYTPDDRPLTVTIEGAKWLPIFSTEQRLRSELARKNVTEVRIKQIDDVEAFFASVIARGLPVCVDLHESEPGRVRFSRLVLPSH